MCCRPGRGLVINPGSVVSAPTARVETSRTFALLDLATLEVTHHDVATGATVAVVPWADGV